MTWLPLVKIEFRWLKVLASVAVLAVFSVPRAVADGSASIHVLVLSFLWHCGSQKDSWLR